MQHIDASMSLTFDSSCTSSSMCTRTWETGSVYFHGFFFSRSRVLSRSMG